MKTFIIYFTGHYPVGAVGIARGVDLDDAVKKFHDKLVKEEPFLASHEARNGVYGENSFANLRRGAYEFTEDATILLNGEY